MKTLIFTSIYSDLWQTEFGGRSGRGYHYKNSLLTILNLKAEKFICFTSENEVNDLENFFYVENNIDKNYLEFIVFDLTKTKYFQEIRKIKNLDSIIKSDRCYEIQYNKFFWLDNIENLNDYDRLYWFDAGLSHGGIFPIQYAIGTDYNQHFKFTLFNRNYLDHINDLSSDKLILIVKNNKNPFFWSQTIPQKYYDVYDNTEHVVGGFFGGTVNNFKTLRNDFENLLIKLLEDEKELYYEELILSCIYQNKKNDFVPLNFDDWYKRDFHDPSKETIKYFYNIFEIDEK